MIRERTLRVNGQEYRLPLEDRRLLLQVLREDLHLTGTKDGCGTGVCGACTVLIDGRPMSACLLFAAHAADREITTIEGLAPPAALHPVQEAFVRAGAFECGFCTPGFVLATLALLRENPRPTPADVRHHLLGNICRCTGYATILRAVDLAADTLAGLARDTA